MFGKYFPSKVLFFLIVFFILIKGISSMHSQRTLQTQRVWQSELVKVKIIQKQLLVYQINENEETMVQKVKLESPVQNILFDGGLLILEHENHFLSIYEKSKQDEQNIESKKDNSIVYEFVQKIQLKNEGILKNVKISHSREITIQYEKTKQTYLWNKDKWENSPEENTQSKVQEEEDKKVQKVSLGEGNVFEALTFSSLEGISFGLGDPYGMVIKDDYIMYSGNGGVTQFLRYNGEGFDEVFNFENSTTGQAVQFDMEKEWLFEGKAAGEINFFFYEEGSFHKKVLEGEGKTYSVDSMSLYKEYLVASFVDEIFLYKWDAGEKTLKSVEKIPIRFPTSAVKMCDENTILAMVFNDRPLFQVYRRVDTQFPADPSEQIPITSTSSYSFAVTDDCSTVIAHLRYLGSGDVHILMRNEGGKYEQVSSHFPSAQFSFRQAPCIHPDGHFFGISRGRGVEIWVKNVAGTDYQFKELISSGDTIVCAISDYMVLLGGEDESVYYGLHNLLDVLPEQEPAGYGKKEAFSFSQPDILREANRKVLGLKKVGHDFVVIEEYMKARTYKKSFLAHELNKNLDQSRFFSSLDADDTLRLLVLGNFDRKAYVYKDTGEGFVPTENKIVTHSQILAVSLALGGRLLLGHMDGSISQHLWEEASSAFTPQGTFSSGEGTRVFGMQTCPDSSVVVLQEKQGWFYLVLLSPDGQQLYSKKIDEPLSVKFSVSHDCSRVFVASNMLKQVEVFEREVNSYSLFRTVPLDYPLGQIANNPDADVFVVNTHTDFSSVVYRYDECISDYVVERVIKGNSDANAVDMTEEQIIIGHFDGTVKVYRYSFKEKVCLGFGKKTITRIEDVDDVTQLTDPTRAITAIDASGQFVLANSLYTGFYFFRIPDEGPPTLMHQDEQIFISSVSIASSLHTFAIGTYTMAVLVYTNVDDTAYTNTLTIQTQSQVNTIDLTMNNKLLMGMANGNITQVTIHSTIEDTSYTNNGHMEVEGSRVRTVKLCPDDSWIALLERSGLFTLTMFSKDDSNSRVETELSTGLTDELVDAYIDATPDCSFIVISGITLQQVQVYQKGNIDYHLFHTIEFDTPLSQVSVQADGDLLIVPSLTKPETYLYQYKFCQDLYTELQILNSGSYDQATAITNQLIIQGNEDGNIKISSYSSVLDPVCETISSQPSVEETENEQGLERMVNTRPETSASLSSVSQNGLSLGMIILIALGSIAVLSIFGVLVCWKLRKSPESEPNSKKEDNKNEVETAQGLQNQIQ